MAKMNSKFKYMYDAAPSIALAANGGVALTADTNLTAYALDQLNGYWNTEGELADQTFAVVINVEDLDLTTGDETYVFSLQFGDAVGFGGGTVITHRLVATAAGQQLAALVDIDTVKAMLDDATHMRLQLDVSGTTPSITFKAFIAGAIIR